MQETPYKQVSTARRREVAERDGYLCQICGHPGQIGTGADDLQIHHKVAGKEGGLDDLDNLITLCRVCHRIADAQRLEAGRAKQKETVAAKRPAMLKSHVEGLRVKRGDVLYTSQGVATLLDANLALVQRWIADGRLPAHQLGSVYVIFASDLEHFERPPRKRWVERRPKE